MFGNLLQLPLRGGKKGKERGGGGFREKTDGLLRAPAGQGGRHHERVKLDKRGGKKKFIETFQIRLLGGDCAGGGTACKKEKKGNALPIEQKKNGRRRGLADRPAPAKLDVTWEGRGEKKRMQGPLKRKKKRRGERVGSTQQPRKAQKAWFLPASQKKRGEKGLNSSLKEEKNLQPPTCRQGFLDVINAPTKKRKGNGKKKKGDPARTAPSEGRLWPPLPSTRTPQNLGWASLS